MAPKHPLKSKLLESFFQSRWFQGGFLLGVLCLLLFWISTYHVGEALNSLEQLLLDMRLKARAEQLVPSDDIVVVASDYETARYTRNHPELAINNSVLPRKRVAQLINYATRQGAKAIILDVEFKTPTIAADDQALQQAIQAAGNVYLAVSFDGPLSYWMAQKKAKIPNLETSPTLRQAITQACLVDKYHQDFSSSPEFLASFAQKGLRVTYEEPPLPSVLDSFTYCQTGAVFPGFLQAARGLGVVRVDYDSDAFIRDVPMLYKSYRGKFYTYLGIRPALDLLRQKQLRYTPERVKIGAKGLPLLNGDTLLINWRNPALGAAQIYAQQRHPHMNINPKELSPLADPGTITELLGGGHLYRKISAIDVLRQIENDPKDIQPRPSLYRIHGQPQTGPFSFKDKVVIYGDTIKDIHRTPIGNAIFGPEIVATVVDMVWHDDRFIQKVFDGRIYLVVLLFILGVITAILRFNRLILGFMAGFLILGLYWVFNFTIFIHQGLWLPLVLPTILLFLALMGGTVYKYYVHDREKHQLTRVFSNYVSPQIMDEILKSPQRAMDNLKGCKKEITVLFADIKNFTQIFEEEDPERMVEQLNEYLDTMVHIILKHEGTIDKYMGDSVMAFFGAPYPLPDHAQKACEAAVEMQEALERLNEKWSGRGRSVLSQGIGISTGMMFVGNFGSENIKDFTVIGSQVNLGARLETYTREVDASIIISETTRQALDRKAMIRDLGKIQVKGFRDPVQVYALDQIS